MNDQRSIRVLRVPGRVRDTSREVKQVQWLHALVAYAELYSNPSLQVAAALEQLRTVPKYRWPSHRLLLDAHAALLCRFSKRQVRRLKRQAWALLAPTASYQNVEKGLGEYHHLDATRLVEACPLFLGDGLVSTYWEGWAAEPGGFEAPARAISVQLSALRDREPEAHSLGARSLVVVAGHAMVEEGPALEADASARPSSSAGGPAQCPLELCYSFWTQTLGPPNHQGDLSIAPVTVVDALPLTTGRAAWAVGVRVVEGASLVTEHAEQALGAAVELVATLTRGQREVAEGPWQLPVMSRAEWAQASVAAILEAFTALGVAVYERAWWSPSPSCVYDSKYLYAVSPASAPRKLTMRAGRYESEVEVVIGSEPVSASSRRRLEERSTAPTQRWSMLQFRSVKDRRQTGG